MSASADRQTADLMNNMLVDESEDQLLTILNDDQPGGSNQLYTTSESHDAQDQSATRPYVEEQKVSP